MGKKLSDRRRSLEPFDRKAVVWAIAISAPVFIYAVNYMAAHWGQVEPLRRLVMQLRAEVAWTTKIALIIGDNGLLAIFLITAMAHAVVMFTKTPSKVKLVSAIAYFIITTVMANLMLRGVMQPMIDVQRALAE